MHLKFILFLLLSLALVFGLHFAFFRSCIYFFITRLLYAGHDYGLSTDGGFQLYTTSGTGSWGPPMRTAGRGEIVRIQLVQKQE